MFWRGAGIVALLTSLVSAPNVTLAQVVTSAAAPLMPSASPETGAALVTADPQSCADARAFTLTTVTRLPGGGTSRVGMAPSDVTACRWVIEGLEPMPEIDAGVYSLEGHVPGTPVRIRLGKGLTPVCRHVPFDDVVYVAAKTGRRVLVKTARPGGRIIPDWTMVDLPESECAVRLTDFAPTPVPGPASEPTAFLFEDFPLADVVVLQIAGRRHELVVSAEGVLVLPF
jgi:hypothetical protein